MHVVFDSNQYPISRIEYPVPRIYRKKDHTPSSKPELPLTQAERRRVVFARCTTTAEGVRQARYVCDPVAPVKLVRRLARMCPPDKAPCPESRTALPVLGR